jgi:DNA-binding MarR family transcriptional regulator
MPPDAVDQVIEQWATERPDLDVSGMAIIGRISRLKNTISPQLREVFAEHELEFWEFDVLATLLRNGSPYRLTAGQLLDSMMVTSGSMTNRLDRLEKRGLLKRSKDPTDGRIVRAGLTAKGKKKVSAALEAHAENERRIVGVLSKAEQAQLIDLMRRFITGLEQQGN